MNKATKKAYIQQSLKALYFKLFKSTRTTTNEYKCLYIILFYEFHGGPNCRQCNKNQQVLLLYKEYKLVQWIISLTETGYLYHSTL
jgi:hypothetical protein